MTTSPLGSMTPAERRQNDALLASLTPTERRYVRGIESMSYAQLAAAFGTGRALMSNSPLSSMTPAERRQNDALLASLTPTERRYVRGIESMSYAQLAAAFGTGR
jgi:DNA-binding CsgD family transcriptional regulator